MSKYIVNSFQVPNAIIDEHMREMRNSTIKCYLVIVRQTTGWNKPSDKISIRKFQEITGIKKRDTIISALSELEKLGLNIGRRVLL